MRIIIETILHSQQRYNTVGDWFANSYNGDVYIKVSNLGSWREEACVAVHELVEMLACLHDGVTEEAVDKFDKSFLGDYEPGDDANAPYRKQHCFATGVERLLAVALGVEWSHYEQKLDETFERSKDYFEKRRIEDGKRSSGEA